jgi:iron complex outermembrane receptor protein
MFRRHLLRGVWAGAFAFTVIPPSFVDTAAAQEALPAIDVGAAEGPVRSNEPVPGPAPSRWSPTLPDGAPAFVEKWQLPNTVASVTRKDIQDKINVVDTEDVVKYLPSLSVRKRNNGETQAVLQTRTWGYGSSARSLVYADDLLLTALIGNDNSIGAPRWGLVAPEEIERVDFLYGPFAAQYPGNSLGGVLKITTRMPEKLEITAQQTVTVQDYSLWGTSRTLPTEITSVTVGDKVGDFSWFLAGNFQNGSQQPLTYVTAASGSYPGTPANLFAYPGAVFETNKFGFPATVLGSTGNLENQQVNAKLKLAYDITPTIRATYTLGFWSNDGLSTPENYTVAGYGPYFGSSTSATSRLGINFSASGTTPLQSFANGYYRIQEKMLVNSAAVKSNTGGVFDFEISASNFSYLQSDQRSPYSGAVPFGGYTSTGRDTRYNGTYWTLLDLKGIVRPDVGLLAGHDISFGLHGDQFHLNNPVWLTTDWTSGMASSYGVVASIGDGTTRTQALWAQDAFKLRDDLKFTVGIRGEHWQASDGYNQSLSGINATGTGSTAALKSTLPIFQPNLYHTRFSPKASLEWAADQNWTIIGSIGLANRFPTAKELYNLATITSNNTVVNPNPNLRPEVALSKELAFERKIGPDGAIRLSLFDEEVRDAIIAQNIYVTPSQAVSNSVNIERIRNSGVEVAARKDNFLLRGLEVSASATYLNARIISDPTWAPSSLNVLGSNLDAWAWRVDGKNVPNIPKWRWTATATYRPDDNWAFTVGARWQDSFWTTIPNNDTAHGVYQSFDRFFVVDTKIHYKWNERWSFDFGIDNIGNYKYFLFHPFPQRTFYFAGKYEFGTDKKGAPGIFYTGNEAGLPDVSSWFQPVAFAWN